MKQQELINKLNQAVERFVSQLSEMRTGVVSSALIENIIVLAYEGSNPMSLKELATIFKIDEYSIFREYLQLLFLSYLYQEKKANKLFFKGGTALRLIFGSPRFSEDLDFSTTYSDSEITKLLKNIEAKIAKEFGKKHRMVELQGL